MRKVGLLLSIAAFITMAGCATVPVNHFQNGKSLGKGKLQWAVGAQLGRNVDYGRAFEDAKFNVDDFADMPFSMLMDVSVQYGAAPKFDIGGELFLAIPASYGFKVHGKYAFLDSTSKWGVALMPVLGYGSSSAETSSETTVNGRVTNTTKGSLSHKAFIAEAALVVSYDVSPRASIYMGPGVYYYSISSREEENGIQQTDLDREMLSPGISLGWITPGRAAFEMTIVAVRDDIADKTEWIPFFGIQYLGLEGLLEAIGLSN